MSEVLEYSYWKEKWIQEYTPNWITISSANDTINHFSYPNLGHIQEGSLMCFGWYNSRENTQWIPWRINSWIVDQLWSDNPELIELLKQEFERQYPIFAGKMWWTDLHMTLWEWYKSYKIRKALPVLVEFILKNEQSECSFQQLYLIWWRVYEWVMTLVWSRSGLYSTFKKIFWYDFPRDKIYPIVQQNAETVKEWRRGRNLSPLI